MRSAILSAALAAIFLLAGACTGGGSGFTGADDDLLPDASPSDDASPDDATSEPDADPAQDAQADAPEDEDTDEPAPTSTLCDVSETLFEPHCTGCHNGSVHPYDLRINGLAERLINAESPAHAGLTMVVPGQPDESFIYQKLVGTQPSGTGDLMPPQGELSQEVTKVLREWIEAGAQTECEQEPEGEVALLGPTERVVRASMALRGVRPSVEELERADELPTLVDEWLESDAFGATIRDMYDETLLLRVHTGRPSVAWKRPLTTEGRGQEESFINSQIQEAPLKLIEYIVREDRPFTEILTADYAIGNVTMEGVWGSGQEGFGPDPIGLLCEDDELEDFPGWKMCTWAESNRNGAGVLSSTFFYVRWRSTMANQHRARANAITNAFLCYDFLDQPVPFDETDADLADVDEVANAVIDNPACSSCHESLDPIASFLYGFTGTFRPGNVQEYPLSMFNSRSAYVPGRRLANLRTPALFGQPGESVADLGRMLTQHPDFAPCAVRRMYAFLDQRSMESVPEASVQAWAQAFVESNYNTKAILRQMVLSDDFMVSHALSEEGADDTIGLKKVRPEQGSRMVEAMTGFRWMSDFDEDRRPYGLVNLMEDSRFGFRVLVGGIDGDAVVVPSHTYNGPVAAVWRAYALEAANHVVSTDFATSIMERRLLTMVDGQTDDPDTVRAQIDALFWQVLAEQASDEELDAAMGLFMSVAQAGGRDANQRAWTVLLGALFQDLRFTHY